ncbi:MAG: proline dehydrogenase family protein [Verrucomicrobiota bacterium]
MEANESRIHELGNELFRSMRRWAPEPWQKMWWHDWGMALSLRRPRVQRQLFRFIDTLPGLRRPEAIRDHLLEYMRPVAGELPEAARLLLNVLPKLPASWIAALIRRGARELAGRFLLGADGETINQHLGALQQQGLVYTIDWLGEAVLTEAEADAYQNEYLRLLPTLARSSRAVSGRDVPAVNVSLKLSALTSRFEPADVPGTMERVCRRLRPILRAAQDAGAFVNVDMEHAAYRDVTLRIFMAVADEAEFRDWPNIGIAIQAYLIESEAELSALLAWVERRGTSIGVRLVKGAYWDYEQAVAAGKGWPSPVFSEKAATDRNFERLTRFLLMNWRMLRPAIASHNVRSIAHTIALREALGIESHEVEFQLLYGMADPLKHALVAMGERVRVYCPVGELLPGIAYLVRRLLENTSNQGFVRAGYLEHRAPEELLKAPMVKENEQKPVQSCEFLNDAPADFSREENRQRMEAALIRLQPVVVDGCGSDPSRWLVSTDPCDFSREVGRVRLATLEDARDAMSRSESMVRIWRETTWKERILCLRRLGADLDVRRWDFAARLVREVGKTWREADAEVGELIDFCRYYADRAEVLSRGVAVDKPGEVNDTFYEARGVTVVIAPWNFPLAILGGMTVAALVTGNPVVMKPAEQAPIIGWELYQALLAAGIPAGVIQYLPGYGEEVGPGLVNHPATAMIAFTGSKEVGLGLNRQAAMALEGRRQVVRVIAEMGGKNAIIVDASADLDASVSGVVASAFGYQGQKCSACSRVIVHRDLYDEFRDRLVAAVAALELGPAEHPGHLFGPVIDVEARDRLLRQIAELRKQHRCLYEGQLGEWATRGSWVPPVVFDEVDPSSWFGQEELFGPVLALMRAEDLSEALNIANGTNYCLTGGCYARSPEALARVRREFRVGNLYLNRGITGALVYRQPFGGFGLSGIGSKAGGPDYLLQFCVPRTVTENTLIHGMVIERESQS